VFHIGVFLGDLPVLLTLLWSEFTPLLVFCEVRWSRSVLDSDSPYLPVYQHWGTAGAPHFLYIKPDVRLWPTMACIDAENLSLFIGDHLRLVIVWRLLRPE